MRDFSELEARRLLAAQLFNKCIIQAEVARRTGVSRESARRWYQRWLNQGVQGLRKAGLAGRRSRLPLARIQEIRKMVELGPRAHGYVDGSWTSARIAEVIERHTGQKYHLSHIWRMTRDWDLRLL